MTKKSAQSSQWSTDEQDLCYKHGRRDPQRNWYPYREMNPVQCNDQLQLRPYKPLSVDTDSPIALPSGGTTAQCGKSHKEQYVLMVCQPNRISKCDLRMSPSCKKNFCDFGPPFCSPMVIDLRPMVLHEPSTIRPSVYDRLRVAAAAAIASSAAFWSASLLSAMDTCVPLYYRWHCNLSNAGGGVAKH